MSSTWLVDETYVKILGKWQYLYRGVDLDGQVLDCWLSATRDLHAPEARHTATGFYNRVISTNRCERNHGYEQRKLLKAVGEFGGYIRANGGECGIGCEDTGEVPSRPGLTQELTGFVPCQRFVGWGGLGASRNHRTTS